MRNVLHVQEIAGSSAELTEKGCVQQKAALRQQGCHSGKSCEANQNRGRNAGVVEKCDKLPLRRA